LPGPLQTLRRQDLRARGVSGSRCKLGGCSTHQKLDGRGSAALALALRSLDSACPAL
jgi:hypothetical protein